MIFSDYRPCYESVWFPTSRYIFIGKKRMYHNYEKGKPVEIRRWVFRFDILGFLFDPIDGILRRLAWDTHMSPSYGSGFKHVWNNICMFLTPWYRNRRVLIENIVNPNDCKLLDSDRKSCYIRNREIDQSYFSVTFGWIFGKAEIIKYVDKYGKGQNTFSYFFSREEDRLTERRRTLIERMPILTRRQCERFFHEFVKKTEGSIKWYVSETEHT